MNRSSLLGDGAPIKSIERAATDYGMPMGPLALYDMVGLDTSVYAGRVMWEAFPDRTGASPILPAMVKAGRLGQKNGRGFFVYRDKKGRGETDPTLVDWLATYRRGERKFSAEELTHRLLLPMVLEATRILAGQAGPRCARCRFGGDFRPRLSALPRRAVVLGRFAGSGQDRRAAEAVRIAGRPLRSDAAAVGNGQRWQEVLRPGENQTLGLGAARTQQPPAWQNSISEESSCRVQTCRDCRLSANPHRPGHKEKGFFRDVRSDDLAVAVVQALVERSGIDPAEIEDVVLGNTQQQGEQGFNVARPVALMAGLPSAAAGTTVNRLCGSSLQAINQAAHAIMAGGEDVQIVGGLEHMQHIAMDAGLDLNPKLFARTSKGALAMGVTAEFLAQTQGISREEQDRFALRSHQLAAKAQANGEFRREMIPIWGRDEAGNRFPADRDQCVRPDTSLEALAALKPAFMPVVGTVTAGNSSPLNDGAAALLIMSEEKAAELGMKPLVRVWPRRLSVSTRR